MQRSKFIVSSGAFAALGLVPHLQAAAAPAPRVVRLVARQRTIDIDGRSARVLELRGEDGFGFEGNAGVPYTIVVRNDLDQSTSIHWHGLAVPNAADGVAGITQPAIAPGRSQTYRFSPEPYGTHWMHGHVPFQEVGLLAAPLILHDPADAPRSERDVVVFLEDFTSRDPLEIWEGLTKSAMTSMPGMDAGSVRARSDLNDVDYDAYLANRRTMNDPEIVRVEPGSSLRLRIINASSGTNYTLDLGRLTGTAIAADGRAIVPAPVGRVPLAIAQRIDVLVRIPREGGTFPIFALREGSFERSGIVLATRGSRVPALGTRSRRPGPVLTNDFERSLRAAVSLSRRDPDVNLTLHLTGDMASYAWGFNGRPFPMGDAAPPALVTVKRGDRVQLTLINRTTMSHPIHLHGHAFQVVAFDGAPFAGAIRDTVLVPPRRAVTFAFDAANPGTWMLHCHNAWHLQSGMATTVKYEA